MVVSFLAFVSAPFVKATTTPYFDSMSKGIRLVFSFSVFILFASVTPLQAQDEVSIPDANLLDAIRDTLEKPTGDITSDDMAGLTSLSANGRFISDLTGLESAVNLGTLNLFSNNIVDLGPLTGLTNINTLGLSGNDIVDLGPLSGLPNLSYLDLDENEIVNLGPLSGLANLSGLYLYNNEIVDIGPLSGLMNLEVLSLSSNADLDLTAGGSQRQIVDTFVTAGVNVIFNDPLLTLVSIPDANLLEAIRDALGKSTGDITKGDMAGLTSLTAYYRSISNLTGLESATNLLSLTLHGNEIVDLSALSGLTSLTDVNLSYNQIVDLGPLSGLTNIQFLHLTENQIVDLSSLSNLIDLERLELSGNEAVNVGPLLGLASLESLYLSNNPEVEFVSLSGLTNLNILALSGNPMPDFDLLSGFTNLTSLYLSGTQVTDLGPLSELSNLSTLDLSGNEISDIGLLSGLTNLSWLYLNDNLISDLAPLSSLTSLTNLFLSDNQIVDLEPLSGLFNLGKLDLSGNQIADITPMTNLTLWSFELSNNQIVDLSPLAGMSWLNLMSLQSFDFSNNQIVDLSPLAEMTGFPITRRLEVDLSGNQINDLTPLLDLPVLEVLDVGANDLILYRGREQQKIVDTLLAAGVDVFYDATDPALLVIDIPDANLLQVIRDRLNKPEGNITGKDMLSLTYFDASNRGISDLTGLESAVGMQYLPLLENEFLDLSGNEIDDLGPLKHLTGIAHLDLNRNRISNISPLSGLVNLYSLRLSDNQIVDFTALSNLTNLQTLDLSGNQISDIGLLPEFSRLRSLKLANNQIVDLTPLLNLAYFTSLYLANNQIVNLEPLSAFKDLVSLDLSNNQFLDIAPLSGLTKLLALDLSGNQVSNLEPLSNMKRLGNLKISNNSIVNLEPLSGLTWLFFLELSRNNIVNIAPLAGLTKLSFLTIDNNDISNLDTLINFADLKYADIRANDLILYSGREQQQIVDTLKAAGVTVVFDATDPSTVVINIADANLLQAIRDELGKPEGDITGEDMLELTELSAAESSISDLTGLESAVDLSQLNLNNNQIVDLSPLEGLTDLVRLLLKSNNISNIDTLLELEALEVLNIEENDLVLIAGSEQRQIVDALLLAGVEVTFATFELSASEVELDSSAANSSIDIVSNISWTVSVDSEWLTLTSPAAGMGDATLSFSVLENADPAQRQVVITVGELELLVTQYGLVGGIYFSDDPLATSSLSSLAETQLSSYAGLWLSDDGVSGKLIGFCVTSDPAMSFAYDLTIVDETTVTVDLGDSTTATLTRDAFGSLSGTLPCVGELTFSKVVPEEGESASQYVGFYEEDSGDGSGAKVFVLVAPSGETIAVAPDLAETFAIKGAIAADGSILVSEESASDARELRLTLGDGEAGFVIETIFLSSDSAKLGSGAATVTVDVGSIGDWTVTEDVAWLAVDTANGSGSTTVTVTIDANTTQKLRVAEVEIGSETFTVRQHGAVDGLGLGFDAWLGAYYLDAEVAVMTPDAKSADPDMDGLSNEDEWKLGFDPTDFASRLKMSVTVDVEGTHVKVWPVGEGVAIGLESSVDLKVWIAVDESSESITDGRYCFDTDSNVDAFYKTVVK